MGVVTTLDEHKRSPLTARLRRVSAAVGRATSSICWIRSSAGTGKTQLLRQLERTGATVLDNPSLDEMRRASDDRSHRLIVATRGNGPIERELSAKRLYGCVSVFDDCDLFCTEDECRDTGDAALFAATGGWPVLVDAYIGRRAADVRALLPEFLEREVLPSLPEDLLVGLFAWLRVGSTRHCCNCDPNRTLFQPRPADDWSNYIRAAKILSAPSRP